MKKAPTTNFQNKLKSYSALAGAIITAQQVNAQVIYTDIIPDSTVNVSGGMYNLDLNNDGIFDFVFNLTITQGGSTSAAPPAFNKVGVNALDSNLVTGSATGAYIYPTAMNSGDTVKSSLTWNIGASQSMGSLWGSAAPYGNWLGAVDKYIGLKLNDAGTIYYGWARLDVDAAATAFTIKDYAYMSTPNQEIVIAGLPLGINENPSKGILVYNDNRTLYVNHEHGAGTIIHITNAAGQEVLNTRTDSDHTVLSLEECKPGIYFVHLQTPEINYTRKIVIN